MTSRHEGRADNRLLRGQETRRRLMLAAEKLIADKGIEQVSIREILREAQQSNTSALQYHFGNLRGLIAAIHTERSEQTRQKRAELLQELLATTATPDLRQICSLMIRPSFELARTTTDYRIYVKAFGQQLTTIEDSAFLKAAGQGAGGASGVELGRHLRRALSHLSDETFQQRLDFAVRLCAAAMSAQASKGAFNGQRGVFFIEGLIDVLVGLLSTPESQKDAETGTAGKHAG
ncbi:MAG: TetR family transcriptional regulator [Pseudomonadota bacterium]